MSRFQEDDVPQKVVKDPLDVKEDTVPKTTFHNFSNKFSKLKLFGFIIFFILIFLILKMAQFQTQLGYTDLYQNTLTGKIYVYHEPGIHLKTPFFSTVTRYMQAWTVNFGMLHEGKQIRQKKPITVRFADTYTAQIPITFRYKLPRNSDKTTMIHREFINFDNLVDSLLIKTSHDVVVNTATQYTGEDFFQGGLNQFKAALEDQLNNGIYKTERKQVEIEQMDLAPVSLEQEKSTQLRKTKTLLWRTVPLIGGDGKVMRLDNPLDLYGIEVTQVTLGEPVPEEQLEQLLSEKKRLVAERIKAVQAQETAKEQAKTAQLRAEIERTTAKQEALKRKELIIIAKQGELEEAQKQAEKEIVEYNKAMKLAEIDKAKALIESQKAKEVAEIEKAKELAIAQAELEIQKAKFEAAQYEAKAILEKGLVDAKILKAKYGEHVSDIYLAEIQKEIAEIIYPHLKGIKVNMPHNVVNLGGETNNKLQTNLDVLSSFATIAIMEKLENKANDIAPLENQ